MMAMMPATVYPASLSWLQALIRRASRRHHVLQENHVVPALRTFNEVLGPVILSLLANVDDVVAGLLLSLNVRVQGYDACKVTTSKCHTGEARDALV